MSAVGATSSLPLVHATARASAASASRAPAHVSAPLTRTQLMSRLEAIQLRAKSEEFYGISSKAGPADGAEEVLTSSHFGDCHTRLQHWWKEHLEHKALFVSAACPASIVTEEVDDSAGLDRPVEFDWLKDRYPLKGDVGEF